VSSNFTLVRLGFALLGGVVLPGSESLSLALSGPRGAQPLALVAVGGGALPSAYHLHVVDVPPPPADLMALAGDGEVGCPLQVRAVVVGEHRRDSFAMLAVDGEARLTHVGDTLRARGQAYKVSEITDGAVMLERAVGVVRCDLDR